MPNCEGRQPSEGKDVDGLRNRTKGKAMILQSFFSILLKNFFLGPTWGWPYTRFNDEQTFQA